MRLPYAPSSPPSQDPSPSTTTKTPLCPPTSEIYTRLLTRRAPHPLLELDLALLHSPPVADGWNAFLGAIRTRTTIPARWREVAVCRVAVLTGAEYEWVHHAPLAMAEGGVGEEGMRSIREAEYGACPAAEEFRGEENGLVGGLDEKQWVVLAYTDRMTREVKVPAAHFERLRGLFNERDIVEITATIAAYNCVSRFLVALNVGEMEEKGLG